MMVSIQFDLKINPLIAHLMINLMHAISENQRKEVSKIPVHICPYARASVLFFNSDETPDLVSR